MNIIGIPLIYLFALGICIGKHFYNWIPNDLVFIAGMVLIIGGAFGFIIVSITIFESIEAYKKYKTLSHE